MRLTSVAGLVLIATLGLSACAATGTDSETGTGNGNGNAERSTTSDRSVTSGGGGASATPATLRFTGETLEGASYDGQQLAGKPAVLWFWAPWCPTCRAQAPHVETIAADYAGQVNVVGVGGLADSQDIVDFAREVDGPTHLIDEEGAIWRHFEVTAQSTYVVLDADGAVVSEGYLDNDDLSAQVAELAG